MWAADICLLVLLNCFPSPYSPTQSPYPSHSLFSRLVGLLVPTLLLPRRHRKRINTTGVGATYATYAVCPNQASRRGNAFCNRTRLATSRRHGCGNKPLVWSAVLVPQTFPLMLPLIVTCPITSTVLTTQLIKCAIAGCKPIGSNAAMQMPSTSK